MPPSFRCAAITRTTPISPHLRSDLDFLILASATTLASLVLSLPDLKIVDVDVNLEMAEDAGDLALVLQDLLPLRELRVENCLTFRLRFFDGGDLVGTMAKEAHQKTLHESLKDIEQNISAPSQSRLEPQKLTSPLLRLPQELKDKIYRLLLVVEKSNCLTWRCPGYSKRRRDAGMETTNGSATEEYDGIQILRFNKQMFYEAKEILYSENRFFAIDMSDEAERRGLRNALDLTFHASSFHDSTASRIVSILKKHTGVKSWVIDFSEWAEGCEPAWCHEPAGKASAPRKTREKLRKKLSFSPNSSRAYCLSSISESEGQ